MRSVLITLCLALMCAATNGSSPCDSFLPPNGGQVTDSWILEQELMQCCCLNNTLGTATPEPDGDPEAGLCNCAGWVAANCKRYSWITTYPVIATSSENSRNVMENGQPVGRDVASSVRTYSCRCYNMDTQAEEHCAWPGQQVLDTYREYVCEGCPAP